MTSLPSILLNRKTSSNTRGAPAQPPAPASPHTPQRGISSTYSSPGAYRAEEENVILSFGSRCLQAGFAGESRPRCTLTFGGDQGRRAGDYRGPKSVRERPSNQPVRYHSWGEEYELWRPDLRKVDLGLVEDKIERGLREAYDSHLLVDMKSRKTVIVLPTGLPHALISVILKVVFNSLQASGLTLLPAPTMSVFAAGLRSAIVVDIGWHETVVSTIYECREISTRRSTRAMRLATFELAEAIMKLRPHCPRSNDPDDEDGAVNLALPLVEDMMSRFGWCPDFCEAEKDGIVDASREIEIDLPSPGPRSVHIPLHTFSSSIEASLLTATDGSGHPDDDELPLPTLLYQVLLRAAPDVRALALSRIVVVGGGSRIIGLKLRLQKELERTVNARGWSLVAGKVAEKRRARPRSTSDTTETGLSTPRLTPKPSGDPTNDNALAFSVPAGHQEAQEDYLKAIPSCRNIGYLYPKTRTQGTVRGVESLGAWCGASLMSSCRIRGVVEIDRDVYLQTGMAAGMTGVRRETGSHMGAQKTATATPYARAGDRVGWSLGVLA